MSRTILTYIEKTYIKQDKIYPQVVELFSKSKKCGPALDSKQYYPRYQKRKDKYKLTFICKQRTFASVNSKRNQHQGTWTEVYSMLNPSQRLYKHTARLNCLEKRVRHISFISSLWLSVTNGVIQIHVSYAHRFGWRKATRCCIRISLYVNLGGNFWGF